MASRQFRVACTTDHSPHPTRTRRAKQTRVGALVEPRTQRLEGMVRDLGVVMDDDAMSGLRHRPGQLSHELRIAVSQQCEHDLQRHLPSTPVMFASHAGPGCYRRS